MLNSQIKTQNSEPVDESPPWELDVDEKIVYDPEEEEGELQTLANWSIIDKRDGNAYNVFGRLEYEDRCILMYDDNSDPVGVFPIDAFFAIRQDAFFDDEDEDDN